MQIKKISIHAAQSPNGKPNAGNCNSFTGLRECDVNLSIAKKLKYKLQTNKFIIPEVIQSSSISNIVNTINNSGSDIFISINCNSGSMQERGTEIHVFQENSEIKNLAVKILEKISEIVGTENRGVKVKSNNYILMNTLQYGISIELAFIDNKEDEKLLRNKQDDFVNAITNAIVEYCK